MNNELEPVIGLEVHVQLKTKSKMFCACSNFSDELPPNTSVCPVCMGHPGTLPVPNIQAVKWGAKTSLALHCQVPEYTKFDRKHYFYPDLPKGYQITQFDQPIGFSGYLKIIDPDTKEVMRININRLHLEEDAAKNTHTADGTLVDYNRGGTPLMEIVSEPDIKTAAQAKAYLHEMRLIMRYLDVSDADMEKGNLRCDANISMRPVGSSELFPKTEIKNINSFNNVYKAIEYEIGRQTRLWLEGDPVKITTTRGWNDQKQITEEQRTKEAAHDYRYFPDPDIPPLKIVLEAPNGLCKDLPEDEINTVCLAAGLPELPYDKRLRFITEFNLDVDDATVLVNDHDIALFTDEAISELQEWVKDIPEIDWKKQKNELVQNSVNWLINRLGKILDESKKSLKETGLTAKTFSELMVLIAANKVNSNSALEILQIMVNKGGDAHQIMIDHNLGQISDTKELEAILDEIITDNPKSVADYKSGKEKALQAMVGQAMAKTKGKANPGVVMDLLKKKLV